jgi:hypothetical protein
MTQPTTDAWIDQFIDKSFRDGADEDYIVARAAFRLELTHSFLWNSLQSLEKYIKAILLYNRRSTLNLGHNIIEGFDRVSAIKEVPFRFPSDTRTFIEYINEEGPNRYRVRTLQQRDDSLIGLDRIVWHLRRHCFHFGGPNGNRERFKNDVDALDSDFLADRLKFHLPGGHLETILSHPSEARKQLVWKNFWFGSRRRRVIKNYPHRFVWSRPVIFKRPEVYFALKDLVFFGKDVQDYFEPGRSKTGRTPTA